MKPIIIIFGVPHSMTSMIARFLIDNGGYNNAPKSTVGYDSYEYPVTDQNLLESLPGDKVCIVKAPNHIMRPGLFEYIPREIRYVYCLRNPKDQIASTLEKAPDTVFIRNFQRYCEYYDKMTEYSPLFPIVVERIHKDGERLLDFCGLNPIITNYWGVKNIKPRKTNYIQYRFSNFWWKKLNKLFNVRQ